MRCLVDDDVDQVSRVAVKHGGEYGVLKPSQCAVSSHRSHQGLETEAFEASGLLVCFLFLEVAFVIADLLDLAIGVSPSLNSGFVLVELGMWPGPVRS